MADKNYDVEICPVCMTENIIAKGTCSRCHKCGAKIGNCDQ